MRLLDNSAIKIDLFPRRKAKKSVKPPEATQTEQPRAPPASTHRSNPRVVRDEPTYAVKPARSMQDLNRPIHPGTDTPRSASSHATGKSSRDHCSRDYVYDHERPGTGDTGWSNHSRAYHQPWDSTGYDNQDATTEDHVQQRAPTVHSKESSTSSSYESRQTGTRQALEGPYENNRRSRADIQDEWEAEQKKRTNIPRGAPHSTNHALKHKHSKADMIRATENMARTLSRSPQRSPASRRPQMSCSPHRSPTSRRYLGAVDDSRPGTSSSNGSFQIPQTVQSNNSKQTYHPALGANGSTTKLPHTEHSDDRATVANDAGQTASSRPGSTNGSDRTPQYGERNPANLTGTSKKQGRAFNSTIKIPSLGSMSPNKTMWSPTSSMARSNNHSRTRSDQKPSPKSSNQPHNVHNNLNHPPNNPSADGVSAEPRQMDTTAGSSMAHDKEKGDDQQRAGNNSNQRIPPSALHAAQRNSIETKKSDHLSLAQRQALASSQQASHQPQPLVVNRPNGTWASYTEDPGQPSTTSSREQPSGVAAANGDQYNTPNNAQHRNDGGTEQKPSSSIASTSKPNHRSEVATQNHGDLANLPPRNGMSHGNPSRAAANDSKPSGNGAHAHPQPSTDNTGASSTSMSTQAANRDTQPSNGASQAIDFARQESSTSASSGERPQKQKPTKTNAPDPPVAKKQYVDAGNHPKSPYHGKFGGRGKRDPRKVAGPEVGGSNQSKSSKSSTNKFSNSSVVMNSTTPQSVKRKDPPPPIPVANNDDAVPRNPRASGRAKVVAFNHDAAPTIVPTPRDSNFPQHHHQDKNNNNNGRSQRKDSGQSHSAEFREEKNNYSYKQGGKTERGYVSAVVDSVAHALPDVSNVGQRLSGSWRAQTAGAR